MIDEPASLTRGSRPTIRDVARVAKVSIGTVSAVINKGGTSVAPHTREHVLRCITELGFEPNNAARSLKRQRISSIGFIVPDLKNSFFADVAEGIQSALDNVDFLLVLCMTWASKEREEYYAQVLRTQRLDGVIRYSARTTSTKPTTPNAARKPIAEKVPAVFRRELACSRYTPRPPPEDAVHSPITAPVTLKVADNFKAENNGT